MTNLLEIKHLSKSYNGIPALRDIYLSIPAGEIHGLIGANGSGKTTLMNILFGNPVIEATGGYEGEIYFNGQKTVFKNCGQAIKQGIGMIHQEFALIPDMTVAENIKLGRENTVDFARRLFGPSFSFVDRKRDDAGARRTLSKLGIDIDVGLKIVDLTSNLKQFVEIAREIDRSDLQLLILDEPTAVLSSSDGWQLIQILKEMSARDIAILFISHRLEEIQQVCDRVSVLRDGRLVAQYDKKDVSINKLARDMIGHLVEKASADKRDIANRPIITFKGFAVDMPGEAIRGLDLEVYEGEILGITSLSGHGKLALGYGMMGMYPVEGEVVYRNQRLSRMDARWNIMNGMYFLPDDRRELGIIADQSVEDNIIFTGNQVKNMFMTGFLGSFPGFVDRAQSRWYVNKMIEDFDIKCRSPKQKVKELSGGNQQKVCIARALTVDPALLFVAEPTRGIDIAAKEKILNMLIQINRSRNTTIVIMSSELDELKRVCDRIAVMVQGKVFKILSPHASDVDFALALSGEEGMPYEQL